MKEEVNYDELNSALLKKALGYDTEETISEYQGDDDGVRLIKKKVTVKNVPPDVTALKLFLDGRPDVNDMTDEELEAEKIRLIKLLESRKGDKK